RSQTFPRRPNSLARPANAPHSPDPSTLPTYLTYLTYPTYATYLTHATYLTPPPYAPFATSLIASRATRIVFSTSRTVCAAERNQASNCDGGGYTPRVSIPRKNLAY